MRMRTLAALIALLSGYAAVEAAAQGRDLDAFLGRLEWLCSTHPYGGACVRIAGDPSVYIDPSHLAAGDDSLVKAVALLHRHRRPARPASAPRQDRRDPGCAGRAHRPETVPADQVGAPQVRVVISRTLGRDEAHEWDRAFAVRREVEEALRRLESRG